MQVGEKYLQRKKRQNWGGKFIHDATFNGCLCCLCIPTIFQLYVERRKSEGVNKMQYHGIRCVNKRSKATVYTVVIRRSKSCHVCGFSAAVDLKENHSGAAYVKKCMSL